MGPSKIDIYWYIIYIKYKEYILKIIFSETSLNYMTIVLCRITIWPIYCLFLIKQEKKQHTCDMWSISGFLKLSISKNWLIFTYSTLGTISHLNIWKPWFSARLKMAWNALMLLLQLGWSLIKGKRFFDDCKAQLERNGLLEQSQRLQSNA